MRITRLQARDIGRHRDLDIALAGGVTVVRGPNEAGKSTVQRIVELALTRKVTSASADLDAIRAWDADEDARPWIRLEFENEDDEGVHTGELEKSFRGAKGAVRLVVDGVETSDPAEADLRIAELTGIPTEPFFRSTASVRHHELERLDRDEATLHDRLQASISGADRGTSAAKKKLDRAIKDLARGGDRNPGGLKVAEEAVRRTATVVEAGEAALSQLEHDRDLLSGARERRAVVEGKLAQERAMLEKARQAERLISEAALAQERFERFRTAVQVRDDIEVLTQSHPSPNPLPVLNQVVFRLQGLDATIRDLTARLAGEGDVRYELEAPEPTWRLTAGLALFLVLAGVALAVAGVLLSGAAVLLPVGAGLEVLAIVIAVFARRQRSVARDLRRQKEMASTEIDRRLRGRSQMEEELKQAQADTEAQLAAVDLPDLATVEALLAAEKEHVARIDQMRATLEGLVGKQPPEALPELRDAAALEIAQKTGALEQLGPIGREPRARERLETVVRDGESALERSRDDEAAARARVEANVVDAEQVAGEAERLAGWREQLAGFERRSRVYQATLGAIERAEQATMRTATRFLEKRMVGDIARITGGRYRRVRVDDRNLAIEVFAPEKGDWVDVSALSQGTLDQVYLAARLGLVRLVTGDRRPPLIFDDPFVTFDDTRAARALDMLHELVGDFQVIYLTTSERYDAAADRVVVLEGPTVVDAGADAAVPTA